MSSIRLNKYLSSVGITSRRKADELIEQGLVTVNGQVASVGIQIDPETDQILVSGNQIEKDPDRIYLMLNKPKGVVSTVSDESGRPTVMELVPNKERVYPVGRLDIDSEGLILLTNDGELTNQLIHPKFHIPKTYRVSVVGQLTQPKLHQLQTGVQLKEGMTAPAEVTLISQEASQSVIQIILHQGWNRQIRRMCGVVGLTVEKLERIAIGSLKLENLSSGQCRYLTPQEIKLLTKKE